ncbi:hypothetical protein DXG03_002561, partial [Asterophora parasitica]
PGANHTVYLLEDFWDSFAWEFYEADVEVTASLTLESEAYYQHEHNIDLYVDSFQSLYQKAGYLDGHHLIMKFWHGLSKKLSDQLGNISTGCPDDTRVEAWMTMACKQAFIRRQKLTLHAIPVASPCFLLAAPAPAPSQPLFPSPTVHIAPVLASAALKSLPMGMLMDINKMRAAHMVEVICHWCSQKGHYKQDCPFCHDLHFIDNKEKDKLTMQLLAWQDTLAAKSQAAASNNLDTYV